MKLQGFHLQALNGQVPKSPADDGPATICANEGEMPLGSPCRVK
jgi:hypothetical protein